MKKNSAVAMALVLSLLCLTGNASAQELGTIVKSIAIPGMGQLGDGQKAKGLVFMAAEVILLSVTLSQVSQAHAYSHKTQYDSVLYYQSGRYEDVYSIYTDWKTMSDKAATAQRNAMIFGGLSAACWLVNIADVLLFPAPRSSDESSLLLDIRKHTKIALGPAGASAQYTVEF